MTQRKLMIENTDMLKVPAEGYQPAINSVMHVWLVVQHPLASDPTCDERRALPLAIVSLGETYGRIGLDGRFWKPTEGDLSDAGKFFVALILDQYSERGAHSIESDIVPLPVEEMPQAVQDVILQHAMQCIAPASKEVQ